ncbi:uncharacterized protein EI90DRAFT_901023 [Cantharellus anzutake]|uniref:uncharacterized protein n=1 Tax=Cantharellus anzutake TaxID=1750568 RepID=UPI0019048B4A|nr:uncharacterized protein EI90DRAFT_901023 [Cantharellus anzutake]KAF8331923.1 hypothetical protein EI90DRAFT_901023 [Cantharellus anzutake]
MSSGNGIDIVSDGFNEIVEVLPPQEMLVQLDGINVAAPMVRFSKLPYRHLVSLYNTHITYTPMILAQEFSRSAIGRQSDFTTSMWERGVFDVPERQFSPKSPPPEAPSPANLHFPDESKAMLNSPKPLAENPTCMKDGIDLNLGCPQKWAYAEKIGSYLLREPNTVRELIRSARDRTGWNTPISIKIRLDTELKRTEQLVKTAIQAGASFITVHGRTRHQPSTHTVDLDGIRFARECAREEVPVIANGDAWSHTESEAIRRKTGVRGVMSGRGLLANPALFAGYDRTPIHAVTNFVHLSTKYGVLPFPLFHRHLGFMLEERFASRAERSYFLSDLVSYAGVIDWLEEKGVMLDSCSDDHLWSQERIVDPASKVGLV